MAEGYSAAGPSGRNRGIQSVVYHHRRGRAERSPYKFGRCGYMLVELASRRPNERTDVNRRLTV